MILGRYVARRFLRSFLLVLASFWGILFLVGLVEEVRKLDAEASFGRAVLLSLLNIPETLYTIMPLIMLLAAVVLFLNLARSSELVVMRASGRSALGILVSPVLTALVLGGLLISVGNPLVSATSNRYDELRSDVGMQTTVSVGRNGVWMRQSATYKDSSGKIRTGQAVISAARANGDATTLYDVSFLILDSDSNAVRRVVADRAILETAQWRLFNAKDWPLGSSTNPERDATTSSQLTIATSLTASSIRDSFGAPSAIPLWKLPAFIKTLDAAGFSALRHRVWFEMELAQPLMMVAMVLLAASFTMRPTRFGGIGQRVLLALVSGLAVFFLRNVAQVLGDSGQIPVLLAAWAPPVIALMFSIALLLHLEDG
ncbi:LPS export ABC transporter permease LptG [Thioclava sp. GXIMD4216]|uniref:LPS export ABC transporter permease LptG n=1 Tax=Thioclava litoralis TaxID=3076557 RepID=A0ABZ1DZT2_9RHOB|nr:LPS export ABC transporter permease LptG [Thioclava sp. FTW29]